MVAAVTIKRNPADQGGRSSTTSRLGILDLKSAPGSPVTGLLESGVETNMPKLDHLELETSCFLKSHFESRKEVCMAII